MIPINMGNGNTIWLPMAHHASEAAECSEPAPEWLVIATLILAGIAVLIFIGFVIWLIVDYFKN